MNPVSESQLNKKQGKNAAAHSETAKKTGSPVFSKQKHAIADDEQTLASTVSSSKGVPRS